MISSGWDRLTPGTLMVIDSLSLFQNSDYGLKIIDFGLAQELGDSGVVDISKLQGTIEFMSPEVRMTIVTMK